MVKYQQDDNFYRELRREVEQFIHSHHKLKNEFFVKLILFFSLEIILYSCFLLTEGFAFLLIALLLGISHFFLSFNISHDGLHGGISKNRIYMNIFKIPFVLLGASPHLWKITHNLSHHHNTNVHEHDFDIITEGTQMVRWTEQMALTPFSKYQHIYAPFLYGFTTLWWLFSRDFKLIRKPELAKIKVHDKGNNKRLVMILEKLLHLTLFMLIPLLLGKGILWVLGAFLITHMTQSVMMAHLLLVAHLGEKTPTFEVDESSMSHTWATHQLLTTANFNTKNWLLSFFMGGLNFQVEHHLFPRVSHVYYYHISKILKKHTQRAGIPYLEYKTTGEALRSHYRLLKRLGKGYQTK